MGALSTKNIKIERDDEDIIYISLLELIDMAVVLDKLNGNPDHNRVYVTATSKCMPKG